MTNLPKNEEEYEAGRATLIATMKQAESERGRAERAYWDAQQALRTYVDEWLNRDRCAAMVNISDGWDHYRCTRKRGHGPRDAYCKQHASMRDRWTKEDREASR